MKSTNTIIAQKVFQKLQHVTPIVHSVLDKATTQSRAFFEKRKAPVDVFLFADLVRYEAKCLFETLEYRSVGYQFVTLSRNGLLLVYEYENCIYSFRIRKADEDGELPAHNLSRTLKRFYNQSTPYLPGFSPEEVSECIVPHKLRLVVVWDVDEKYILTNVFLACPRTASGDVHFADKIEHSAKAIAANSNFDDEPEEIEEINIQPLKNTGTDHSADGNTE